MERHAAAFRRPELLKAIRALSARYVETRATLPARSPLDSAGKRAAFAAFYGPLHFLTTRKVVRALGLHRRPLRRIADLGCGTGVAGAGWAVELAPRGVELDGVDASAWAVSETAWTWRTLGYRGRVRRGDLVRAAETLARSATLADTGVVLGWSVNELTPEARERLLPLLVNLIGRGASLLVVEPIARRLVPWWDDWSAACLAAGGRSDEWRFAAALPDPLADLDEAAGFQRGDLTARTLSA
jgi:SAM-dependent methyltransferase